MINRKALMRCLIVPTILSLTSISGCTYRDIYSNSDSETDVTVYETVSEASSDTTVLSIPDTSSKAEKKVRITAEVKSYKDGTLCFEYESNEYALPMTKDKFENEIYIRDSIGPNISERIINNNLGEKISAKITLNENMDKIIACDVINSNGKIDNGMSPYNADNTVNEDMLYTMKRTEKSLCEISNSEETIECDLNDLPLCMKLDYPETVFPVMIWIYKFNDGKVILFEMEHNVQVDADWVSAENDLDTLEMYGKRTGFFATVQIVYDDTITVLLNDNITYCTVPTYYNDGGEIVPGSEVIVLLNTESDFFGKGGDFTFDYAVIVTDSDYYKDSTDKNSTDKFNELAYAVFSSWDQFLCTRIDQIKKN